jgi:hypothetical protein
VVYRSDAGVLLAQIVAAPYGEIVRELALPLVQHIKLPDLISTMHICPTYAVGIEQLATEVRLDWLAASPMVSLGGSWHCAS